MSNAKRNIFVTTALPYANGAFHFGHILEYIQADIWVRHERMCGNNVQKVCATLLSPRGPSLALRAIHLVSRLLEVAGLCSSRLSGNCKYFTKQTQE